MKISAIVLVGKNEPYLEYCLKSIENIVDEIIYVMPINEANVGMTLHSIGTKNRVLTQNTKEIDFAKWRNQALEACCGDFVFWIDADEVFANLDGSPVSRKSFEGLCKSMDSEGYPSTGFFTRHFIYNYFTLDGRNNGLHVSADRLFKADSVKGWQGAVHERVVFKTKRKTRNIMGPAIWHFGHCKGIEDIVKRYRSRHIKDNPFTGKMSKNEFDRYLRTHQMLRGTLPLSKYDGPMPKVMNLW